MYVCNSIFFLYLDRYLTYACFPKKEHTNTLVFVTIILSTYVIFKVFCECVCVHVRWYVFFLKKKHITRTMNTSKLIYSSANLTCGHKYKINFCYNVYYLLK